MIIEVLYRLKAAERIEKNRRNIENKHQKTSFFLFRGKRWYVVIFLFKLAHLIATNYMASWLESLDQIVNLWTILTTYDDHCHH